MTVILVVLAAGLGALAWVTRPLLRMAHEAPPADEDGAARLNERREVLYENIRDLDFEHAMGKLAEDDYRAVRERMVEEAAGVLAQIDATGRDTALDRWIEAEIALRRGGTSAPASCPSCRQTSPPSARFCDGCGAALAPAPCPACGTLPRPGARFCGGCGRNL